MYAQIPPPALDDFPVTRFNITMQQRNMPVLMILPVMYIPLVLMMPSTLFQLLAAGLFGEYAGLYFANRRRLKNMKEKLAALSEQGTCSGWQWWAGRSNYVASRDVVHAQLSNYLEKNYRRVLKGRNYHLVARGRFSDVCEVNLYETVQGTCLDAMIFSFGGAKKRGDGLLAMLGGLA